MMLEMAVLFLVCWLPQDLNSPANVLTSFVCGLQVESFRSVHGNAMATTMCIGNLRSGTYYLGQYFRNRNAAWIRKAALYYGMILFFVLGAVAESFLIRLFAEKAILLSVSLLMTAFLLMLSHPDTPSPRRSCCGVAPPQRAVGYCHLPRQPAHTCILQIILQYGL